VWQHYVSEVSKSVTLVLQITSVHCVSNFIEKWSKFVETTEKQKMWTILLEHGVQVTKWQISVTYTSRYSLIQLIGNTKTAQKYMCNRASSSQ